MFCFIPNAHRKAVLSCHVSTQRWKKVQMLLDLLFVEIYSKCSQKKNKRKRGTGWVGLNFL